MWGGDRKERVVLKNSLLRGGETNTDCLWVS